MTFKLEGKDIKESTCIPHEWPRVIFSVTGGAVSDVPERVASIFNGIACEECKVKAESMSLWLSLGLGN